MRLVKPTYYNNKNSFQYIINLHAKVSRDAYIEKFITV